MFISAPIKASELKIEIGHESDWDVPGSDDDLDDEWPEDDDYDEDDDDEWPEDDDYDEDDESNDDDFRRRG
jgi:hypothetical protein